MQLREKAWKLIESDLRIKLTKIFFDLLKDRTGFFPNVENYDKTNTTFLYIFYKVSPKCFDIVFSSFKELAE